MTLDDIKAGEEILMTDTLIRLFAYAGCKPTMCHACETIIAVGDKFKLVSHKRILPKNSEVVKRIPGWAYKYYSEDSAPIDEMCCGSCGEKELVKRDKKDQKTWRETRTGGYSRASIGESQ